MSGWIDPDDAPDLTDAFFDQAEIRDGEKVLRRGRPRLANTKKQVMLRIDADILEEFKSARDG